MQIDITKLLNTDQFPLSHSAAEGGQNAGQNTWKASLEAAEDTPLLNTPEKIQAMRDFARASGGWNEEECDAWTDHEVNALFLQWVAGSCRDLGADCLADIDWRKARKLQEEGVVCADIWKQGRKVFFGLDC